MASHRKHHAYANVHKKKPLEFFDYDNVNVSRRSQDDFEIVRPIGEGMFSEVFQGVDKKTNQLCAIKVLKPVAKSTVRREIKILDNLRGLTNIITLLAVIGRSSDGPECLVFEYVDSIDLRKLCRTLPDHRTRYYMFQLLLALDACHSMGIMHRDVKPGNIVVDDNRKQLRLIDWGQAEFYYPDKTYSIHVGTRYFKSPELLLPNRKYDYSVDLWSVGCILAGIVFGKRHIFAGTDNASQLLRIVEVLGSEQLCRYARKYKIKIDHLDKDCIDGYTKKSWQSFVTPENQQFVCSGALDLIDKLLRYDHRERLTAKEAMEHDYFAEVRESNHSRGANEK